MAEEFDIEAMLEEPYRKEASYISCLIFISWTHLQHRRWCTNIWEL